MFSKENSELGQNITHFHIIMLGNSRWRIAMRVAERLRCRRQKLNSKMAALGSDEIRFGCANPGKGSTIINFDAAFLRQFIELPPIVLQIRRKLGSIPAFCCSKPHAYLIAKRQ